MHINEFPFHSSLFSSVAVTVWNIFSRKLFRKKEWVTLCATIFSFNPLHYPFDLNRLGRIGVDGDGDAIRGFRSQ